MNKNISRLLFLGLIFFVSYIMILWLAEMPNNNPFGDKQFIITTGESVSQIGKNLKQEGFITKQTVFKLYVYLTRQQSKLRAGEYTLNTGLSMKEIVDEFARKTWKREEKKITIIEGWRREDIAEYLEAQGLFSSKDFMAATADARMYDYEFLSSAPKEASLEGFLYPDTYMVYADSIPNDVVIKMLNNFDQKIDQELRLEIGKQKKSFYDVLILASIVEKEVSGYENRQKVANVFQQRLNDRYPLQSDATVNYITQKGETRSSLDDLKISNPYNTYKYSGLPPTPISNPSYEAIKATVYQVATPYYFFLTTPDGKVIFGRNLDEHNANIYKYLK